MMRSYLAAVFFITCFFCCVSVTSLLEDQVEILLAFKNEFPSRNCDHGGNAPEDIPLGAASSWGQDTNSFEKFGPDISSWDKDASSYPGVGFNKETGVVTSLSLRGSCISGIIQANSSLFKLQHLTHLDLSRNHFDSSLIPAGFGRLNNVYHLDLSESGFIGKVPSSISNLSRLSILNLSNNKLTGEVPSSITNLTSLSILNLSNNKLTGRFPPIHNLTELSKLDLSYNNFSGTISSSLFTLPSLTELRVHQNRFRDPLEKLTSSSTSKLEYLDVAENLFSCRILESISNLANIQYLDLSFQKTTTCTFNFDFLPFKSLGFLDLSGNSISMLNTDSTGLWELILSSCNITEFPPVIYNLRQLDISNNRLKGNVPEWLWNLPTLHWVDLSHNSLSFSEDSPNILLNSYIKKLDLSANAFQGSFPIIPPYLEIMAASSNNFSGGIPLTICSSRQLKVLDLSNNNFNGSIPRCLISVPLVELKLSNNNLTGTLPDMKDSLILLDVGHNQISGKLPRSLVHSTELMFLNVESNRITDTFPFCLEALEYLEVMVLRSNRFHGPISSPGNPLSFPALRIIDISHNKFYGSMPSNYFANWSLPMVNITKNVDRPWEDRPEYLGDSYLTLSQYPSIYLRNKGLNMEFEKIQEMFTAIDFSGNNLEGQIPESIGLLKVLIVLDLSNNSFTGHIPSSLANLTQLESLDLSRNQLNGKIPQELTASTFLAYINMSHNKLRGQIPQGAQFGGQTKSCFQGNIDLCGLPLEETCFKENETPSTPPQTQEAEQEQVLNWKAAVIGYGPGVLFGVAIAQALATYKPLLFYKLFRL